MRLEDGGQIESDEGKPLRDKIEKTAARRAVYTRSFFETKGRNLDEFIENLKKEPFKIEISKDDDISLALGIFDLQKKLGFPEIDSAHGCDAMFGPYTNRIYEARLVKDVSRSNRTSQLASNIGEETLPAEEIKSTPEALTGEVPISQTIFAGDSIMVGAFRSGSLNGAENLSKGAQQTRWVLDNFTAKYLQIVNGVYSLKEGFKHIKKLVVLFGVNNVTDPRKSIASICKDYREIIRRATEAGVNVALCTIPDFDTAKTANYYKGVWKKRGWHVKGDPKGHYPFSAEDLARRTNEVNDWIRAKQGITVVDLNTEMRNRAKYPRADSVHPSQKGSRAMAEYIRAQANIA